MPFQDRTDAGRWLGGELAVYADCPGLLILAVSPGGVPVASAVAHTLKAPLDVLLVRRMTVPGEPTISLGAVSRGGMHVINHELVNELEIPESVIGRFIAREQQELARWEHRCSAGHSLPALRDRTVILVDDGMTTGCTMRAAVAVVRQQHPARVIVAVPVASASACQKLAAEADTLVCLCVPQHFYSVGLSYRHFATVTEDEVCSLLQQATEIQANESHHIRSHA